MRVYGRAEVATVVEVDADRGWVTLDLDGRRIGMMTWEWGPSHRDYYTTPEETPQGEQVPLPLAGEE